MRECANCGAEVPDGNRFCGGCGQPVPPADDAESGQSGSVEVADNILNRSTLDARHQSSNQAVNINLGDIGHGADGTPKTIKLEELVHCRVCGRLLEVPTWRCPECHEYVCEEHYVADEFMCLKCVHAQASARAAVPVKSGEELWVDAKAYCARLRLKGKSDAEVADGLRRAGWQQERIEKLLGDGLKPTAARSMIGDDGSDAEDGDLPTTLTEHGMELVLVPAGPFMMGSDDGGDSEQPVHEVHLDAYYMGKYPVTNAQYREFVNSTGHDAPKHWTRGHEHHRGFSGDDQPVVYVDWHDAVAYCRWLSRETGEDYFLPTEAQWEKAARGTNGWEYPWGDEAPSGRLCNFEGQIGDTTAVGEYPRGVSPYGCHDMAGNVWEWCSDWYAEDYYQSSPTQNPGGPSSGEYRVVRGGSWNDSADGCRSAFRDDDTPDDAWYSVGFRVSRS